MTALLKHAHVRAIHQKLFSVFLDVTVRGLDLPDGLVSAAVLLTLYQHYIAARKPISASALARRLGIPRTTLLRRLDMLIKSHHVERHGTKYVPGPAANPPCLERTIHTRTMAIFEAARKLSDLDTTRNQTLASTVTSRLTPRTHGAGKRSGGRG